MSITEAQLKEKVANYCDLLSVVMGTTLFVLLVWNDKDVLMYISIFFVAITLTASIATMLHKPTQTKVHEFLSDRIYK